LVQILFAAKSNTRQQNHVSDSSSSQKRCFVADDNYEHHKVYSKIIPIISHLLLLILKHVGRYEL